ncbi:MAG: hypothetical protein MZU84_04840 [Sphingobacterium sp.]|nr:hypothetical protein [Sphingobacterium sp.]
MVDVGNARHGETAVAGHVEQQQQEGDRIGAARHGGEHPRAGRDERITPDREPDAVLK